MIFSFRTFDDLMAKTGGDPDRKTLARFVEDHFTLENQLEEFEPQDWTDEPSILEVISGKSPSHTCLRARSKITRAVQCT